MNLYSARAQVQRRAASLLHGMDEMSGLWEELDGLHLADDERGDRTSLLLGGTAGGVALPPTPRCGLFAAAGAGTIFLKNIEKLSLTAQHVLFRILKQDITRLSAIHTRARSIVGLLSGPDGL